MTKAKAPETSFWKLLRNVQPGANTMGDITQQGTVLTSQLDAVANPQGKIFVSATMMGAGGFQLNAVDAAGDNIEKVYWLPWQDGEATCIDRRDYEGSKDCDFFMTTALTGCRFTLTPTQVVHVANNAYAGNGTARAGRTAVEEGLTGPRNALTRRLSISAVVHDHDLQYNQHRTLVFGVKDHLGAWAYKIFMSHPAPGSWATM